MEIMLIAEKIRSFSLFNIRRSGRLNLYISVYPRPYGGGSNTFSRNFKKWVSKHHGIHMVYNIGKADGAIIIANMAKFTDILEAKRNGCFIIHRLDEYIEENESAGRREKHRYIKELNSLADVTVYQSNFVFQNMHPFLGCPGKYAVIHNGAHPDEFFPAKKTGDYIGHITWSTDSRKRLDLLYEIIRQNPKEKFLLVGNHKKSGYDFDSCPNTICSGPIKRKNVISYLQKMKFLFFPSENDPCPNTVIESIMAGIPVCYNPLGGTAELVEDCGVVLNNFDDMIADWPEYRNRCLRRKDLDFNKVADKYLSLKTGLNNTINFYL